MDTKHVVIRDACFPDFINRLVKAYPVIGPVARKTKFIFDRLASAEDLRLDYDVTILPPKKVFFPVKQDLVTFGPDGVASGINPVPMVLFGVHFYDIKAIDMLDTLFEERYPDNNYLAQREKTILVGSSVQKVSPRAFWGSVGRNLLPKGHDAFLTKIDGGYVLEVRTVKGMTLLEHADHQDASREEIDEAARINNQMHHLCQEKLDFSSDEIAEKVRNAFKNPIWDDLSKQCFSCGTCNIVCPTCYCFDVQDTWNLDQVSGRRTRSWDGCLCEDFAKVSLGAGACENFREDRSERFRHRVMRKTAYLNEKLDSPACVGCGRCSVGCVPDIADPVRIVSRIMEV
ncbi:MAG TPA: 4Fe-4S dicluster domain-containing protein [Thermoanaerobaculia bacterium]|nr:4Fe-4S dicluster domain-containing protein [Thermoanaerobaculia bacterium]HXK69095.1 4Fe-4S dicluster domain-containing protein [Thermoanaerobaculia bacterium]